MLQKIYMLWYNLIKHKYYHIITINTFYFVNTYKKLFRASFIHIVLNI